MAQINTARTKVPLLLKRWHATLLGILLVLVVLFLVFDWNWFRKPLENYISDKTKREFQISSLDVDLGSVDVAKSRILSF